MKCIVKMDLSPKIKKGDILIKKGKYFTLKGEIRGHYPTINTYTDPKTGEETEQAHTTPNFYTVELVKAMKDAFKIIKQ